MYFHVYLIYRFTHTFTDHSSVITRCWGFELQNGKSSLKSPQTLATQDFAPASFLSTPDKNDRKSKDFRSFSMHILDRIFCYIRVFSSLFQQICNFSETTFFQVRNKLETAFQPVLSKKWSKLLHFCCTCVYGNIGQCFIDILLFLV